jgi:capsular polysaccharide transport system ATP-binding protein
MMARLAFGLSMAIEFECYLVDEITAVGDARFQQRCKVAFDNRRKSADIIMVSHGMDTIKEYCDKGVLLVDGRMMVYEDVEHAIEAYYRLNR